MDHLRVVTVLEHEVVRVVGRGDALDGDGCLRKDELWISEDDALALMQINELRRGLCERVQGGVRFAQFCGIVRLHSCVLEILPKIGMSDDRESGELGRSRAALLSMLHHARQFTVTSVGLVRQSTVHAPLLDIFIEAFLRCASEQARRGMLSRYVPQLDDLPVLRGRLHVSGQIRRNLVRPHLLHCEHDDFTGDNAYNRAIRATLNACQTWVSRPSIRRQWFETSSRFAGIASVRMSASEVARLPRNRSTRRYDAVLKWCELLLSMSSPAMSAGLMDAPGLLFDMNKLFEAHVSRLEEVSAGDAYVVSRQGPQMPLAIWDNEGAFQLKPDVMIWRAGQGERPAKVDRIIDAKW